MSTERQRRWSRWRTMLLGRWLRLRSHGRSQSSKTTYAAFISYSRAADGRLAPALRDALHDFARPWYQLRALRVFRDEASLSASPELWPSIEAALANAEFFVLLASPESARSYWVDREVAYWLAYKPMTNILIALTGGAIVGDPAKGRVDAARTNALPPSLVAFLRSEPRYVDLRWAATEDHVSISNPEFRACVADLAAPMHHRAKEDLIGEDVRQHRRVMRLTRATIATLTMLAIATTSFALVAVQQRNRAQQEASIAFSRQLAAEANASRDSQFDRSLLLSVESERANDTMEARSALVAGLQSNSHLLAYVHSRGTMRSLALAADGTLMISSDPGTITLWDPRANRLVREAQFKSGAGHPQFFSPEGKILAAGRALWDVETGQHVVDITRSAFWAVAFSIDGKLLAVDTEGGPVLLDPLTGRGLGGFTSNGDVSSLRSLAFSRDGHLLAGGNAEGRVFLWDVQTRRQLVSPLLISPHPAAGQPVEGLSFSSDGAVIAAADFYDDVLGLWDVRSGQSLGRSPDKGIWVKSMASSPDQKTLALGTADGRVILWDVQKQAVQQEVVMAQVSAGTAAVEVEVDKVAFSPDGRLLAAGNLYGRAAVWTSRECTAWASPFREAMAP